MIFFYVTAMAIGSECSSVLQINKIHITFSCFLYMVVVFINFNSKIFFGLKSIVDSSLFV